MKAVLGPRPEAGRRPCTVSCSLAGVEGTELVRRLFFFASGVQSVQQPCTPNTGSFPASPAGRSSLRELTALANCDDQLLHIFALQKNWASRSCLESRGAVMGWKTCPECHWPLDLSSECCAICGGIAWEQPVTDGEAPKEPYVINGRGDVWKRCTPHILAGIFAIIGWLVFPPKLFALQLLITGGYLAAVGVWTYRLAMTNSRTYEPRNLHQEAGWCGAGAIAVILLAGSLFTKDGHATDGLRQRGSRTLEYWNQISQLERQANTKTPEALVASLQGIIVSLERLDSTGVDPDAVDYLFRKIQVFRKLIAHNERFQSLSILVESFLRGAMGDPFGTTKEMNDSEREIQQDLEQLVIDRKRLAAVFAARYSLTFQ